jgi:hypothetical protein
MAPTTGGAAVPERVWTEKLRVQGEAIKERVEQVVREGNVRRIIIRNDRGEKVLEMPVTIGVVGVAAAPMLSAVGALVGLAARWTLEVERVENPEPPDDTAS